MDDSAGNGKKLAVFNQVVMPKERVYERTQGCWNCKHMQPAKEWWTQKRQENLDIALGISNDALLGEKDQRVVNIRRMVDFTDRGIASGVMIRCGKNPKGQNALGEPVGDLVANSFLCDGWSAAQGASVARAGAAPDKLPEELMERLDGPDAVKKRPLS